MKSMKKLNTPAKLVLIAALFGVLFIVYRKIRIEVWGVYTVATLTGVTPASRGTYVEYSFVYQGQTYKSALRLSVGKEDIGAKYFVGFLESDPGVSLLKMDGRVPSCLHYSEGQVWKKLPKCK